MDPEIINRILAKQVVMEYDEVLKILKSMIHRRNQAIQLAEDYADELSEIAESVAVVELVAEFKEALSEEKAK
jgi:preprotein translocase subunit SecA